jgi:uncharacterized protein (DUF1684 family)
VHSGWGGNRRVPYYGPVRTLLPAVVAVALAVTACRGEPPVPESPPFDPVAHASAVEAWRAKHDTDYRRDWVSIAGLHMLKPGDNTAGSAPASDVVLPASVPPAIGKFVLAGEIVRFAPAPRLPVLLKDQPVTSEIVLQDGAKSAGELTIGDVRLVVHVTGDRRAIRVRDPNGPLAKEFAGFAWFPIDPQYRVVGRFIKDAEQKSLKVPNTFGDDDAYTTEGVVEFTLLGQTLRLRPFTTRPKRFYFVFRDASAGAETYETARFLYADLLDDGTTVLDFNQAYNPPCAFNPYTTCPIPLRENRLAVKILAGEKAYAGKVK